MTEEQRLEESIDALHAQRALLGDGVVDMATAPLRARLEALRAEHQARTQAQPAPAQSLKMVTVLFVDVVGSTALSQRLDPEDLHAVFDGALAAFTACIQAQHGRVLQYAGDGLLAAFGTTEAREDDAECAVRAGLAILEEARRRGEAVQREHAVDGFNVRVGAHTGPVLLGGGVDAEGTIRGSMVSLAARMEQLAPPGGFRIHHDTYRHVRGVFNVTAEAPLLVKGSSEPQPSYLVHSAKPRAFRVVTRGIDGVESRMVARELEFEQLQEAFGALFKQPQPQPRLRLVHVVGEAGLGKSRLIYEFENWAEAQPQQFCWFRGRAEPQMRQQPFGLLRNLFAWRLEIADDDDAETARRKLCEGVEALFAHDAQSQAQAQAHLLGHLLGLDFSDSPHVRGILDDALQLRNRGFHAAAEVLRQTARHFNAPPLMLLDDLHWADDGSLDFLSYLTQVQRNEPMLVVCMTRQTLFERRADWDLIAAAHQRIDLQTLDKRGARELAGVLLQRLESVPAALRELVISGAEGNPFHMEELVRMLIDDGAIVTEGERWQVRADKLLAAHVPATLTGVLQARLDSLPADEKLALQQACVIGYVFWDTALAAIDPAGPQALAALVRRGLLVPHQHATFDGQKEYAFKHLALHQVTYESVLKRAKRELHARVAQWFLQLGGDSTAETLGPAAEHFERAGDSAQACSLFVRAAERAAARSASEAMRGFVARALHLAESGDAATQWRLLSLREPALLAHGDRAAHEADLQALSRLAEAEDNDAWRARVALRRGAAWRSSGDFVAAEAEDRRGLALVNSLPAGAARRALSVAPYHGLAASLVSQGRYPSAREVAEAGLQLAHTLDDLVSESHLVNALGLIAMECGELGVALRHFERGLAMVRDLGNRGDEALRLSNLGSVYPRLGDYQGARRCLEQGLQVAREVGCRHDEAALLLNTASVAHLQADDTAALSFAAAAFDSALANGQRDLQAFARLVAGHAELGLGRLEDARAAYSESRDMLQALNLRPQQVLDPISGLARVALAAGDLSAALACAELLLAHQAGGGSFDGTEEPLLLPLTCWRVLHAASDPRAARVLEAAVNELNKQAARIDDEALRRDFLQRVPHHRELMRAWQARRQPVASSR